MTIVDYTFIIFLNIYYSIDRVSIRRNKMEIKDSRFNEVRVVVEKVIGVGSEYRMQPSLSNRSLPNGVVKILEMEEARFLLDEEEDPHDKFKELVSKGISERIRKISISNVERYRLQDHLLESNWVYFRDNNFEIDYALPLEEFANHISQF
jgi:hypothetical protein